MPEPENAVRGEPDYYVIDRALYSQLRTWKSRFGEARRLTGDEMRDLENFLWLLLDGAMPLEDLLGE